jgi:hypothetical protein
VPNAGGAPDGKPLGVCARLLSVMAAPIKPTDVSVRNSLRDFDISPPNGILQSYRQQDFRRLGRHLYLAIMSAWPVIHLQSAGKIQHSKHVGRKQLMLVRIDRTKNQGFSVVCME